MSGMIIKLFKLVIFTLVLSIIIAPHGQADVREAFYLGLNYPGLSAGYRSGKTAYELRLFFASKTQIYGGRVRRDFYQFETADFEQNFIYLGLDGFYTQFEGEITEGDGFMLGLVGGLETRLTDGFSVNFDLGPYYLTIDDDYSGLNSSSLHYILNFGINYHF